MIANAISILFTMIIMLGCGMLARHFGILKEGAEQMLSGLIVRIFLPALIVHNLLTNYTRDTLLESFGSFSVPFFSVLAAFFLSLPVAKAFRIPSDHRGQFSAMFFLSNSVFVGLPVVRAIFGEEAVSYGLLSYLAITILFWTIGYAGIQGDALVQAGQKRKFFSARNLKNLLSPPLVALALSFVLLLLNITLPKFLMEAAGYMGAAVTPLSMAFIGAVLYSVFRRGFRWHSSFLLILAGRFLIAPALTYGIGQLFGVSGLPLAVFVIQSAMPVMTQVSIVASIVGADEEYTTSATLLTTLAGLACIPLYTLWISTWGI